METSQSPVADESHTEETRTGSEEIISKESLSPTPETTPNTQETSITYEIVEEPRYPPTRALFIGNLTSPFDNSQLQTMLEDGVKECGSYIERAWLNQRRSHSIVIVSDTTGAQLLRDQYNGKIFPLENSDETSKDEEGVEVVRKALYIDFIPVKVVQSWIDQEDDGPVDALWKIEYEIINDRVIAQHKITNYSSIEQKSSNFFESRDKHRRDGRGRGRGGRGNYRGYDDWHTRGRGRGRGGYGRFSGRHPPEAEPERRDQYYSSNRGSSRYDRYGPGRDRYYDGYRGGSGRYPPRDEYRSERPRRDEYRRERPRERDEYNERPREREEYSDRPRGRDDYSERSRGRDDYGERSAEGSRYRNRGRNDRSRDRSSHKPRQNDQPDDRDRSRSPVRSNEVDWDLEGEK